MKARLVQIGNSKGVRLPVRVLELYRLDNGDEVDIEERPDGILLKPVAEPTGKLPRATAYAEMARENAERSESADWDATIGDGLDD